VRTVVALLILAAYMTFAVGVCRLLCRHFDRLIARRNARSEEPQTVPAAPDNTEGTRLDWHDHCELLWAAPYDPQTGLDRIRHDYRNQQREEEDRP
jgi:hypothetical protein